MGKIIHGLFHHPLYPIWQSMKQRCNNINHPAFYRYGGRGIEVCNKWLNSFPAFLEDMGERPGGYTIERINNDKGYSPDNCKWASRPEQSNNTHKPYSLMDEKTAKKAKAKFVEICKKNSALRKNPPKICQFCKGEYSHRQGHTKHPPKYCSRECYFAFKREQTIIQRTMDCLFCGNTFVRGKDKKARYCSISCGCKHRASFHCAAPII